MKEQNLIFGLGTGRCGTVSLSKLLNAQQDSFFTHENGDGNLLPWRTDEEKINKYIQNILNRKRQFAGDVSFYLLPYADLILKKYPSTKFVIMKRAKEETIKSYKKKTQGRNHWMTHNGARWNLDNKWDPCYPKYQALTKEEALSQYYDKYYESVEKIPEQNKYLLFTKDLNNKEVCIDMLHFCGFQNPFLFWSMKIKVAKLWKLIYLKGHCEMKKDTNFESAKKFISLKRLEGPESLCGPGSHYENAKEVIGFLGDIINKYEVKSILDLGCGDWNWFQHINLRNSNYIGWDCDHEMIEQNNLKYGSKNVSFEVKDIVTNKYPKCDLIICRDVLFHLKTELSLKIISNIKKSCNYFLSTSFKSAGNNTDIKSYCKIDNWGFYNINLHKEPFMLSEFECDSAFEKKASPPNNPRYVCLFDFSKIKNDG